MTGLMIPKTFHDANPEDRRYALDYWSWLQDQPQDAWLLWARCANWDNADTIFEAMVNRADCDLALISWLFWMSGPAIHVDNPEYYRPSALIRVIVENVNRSFYRSSELFYDRYEVAMAAHQYVSALRKAPAGSQPFHLPRALCGPFNGRRAEIPARYDAETEQGLTEIFRYMNGGLPRSEAEHLHQEEQGGNAWLKARMALPTVPRDALASYRHLDDASYIEAIFGKNTDFLRALADERSGVKPRRSWWPFS